MSSAEDKLPHWDMSTPYPSLESAEFAQAFDTAVKAIDDLVVFFDKRLPKSPRFRKSVSGATVRLVEQVIGKLNDVLERISTLRAYINGYVSTDSRNALGLRRESELDQQMMRLELLDKRLTAWIGALDVEAIVARSAIARDHALMLRKAKAEAAHLMSPAEEALATELNLTGGNAWSNLYRNFSSQLTATIELEGKAQEAPMSRLRILAFSPDRDLRRRAYEAEVALWQRAAVPIAAAMNSIKGEVGALCKKRGYETPLDASLFDCNIDRQTLDAMLTVARESLPDFRRYLRAKATALGLGKLAWYDIFAPVGGKGKEWSFDESTRFITAQFATFSPRLSGMAERAFRDRWVDAEPRAGKEGGAFCMSLQKDESRVLMNFSPSFNAVDTLAHELGHAYHNVAKAQRTPLQRRTPMTLAETASIFAEKLVQNAAMKAAAPAERLAILESSLQNATQVVVDILSRFLFEQRLFDQRTARELSVEEMNALMLQAQRETYGDGLDESALHPYMWAAKVHYYSTGRFFYNFPYMFGLLFGLGLYARYQKKPSEFKQGYDDLLASTGLEEAAPLAARFGIDLRTPVFWRASLDMVREDIKEFEKLVK